MRVLGQAGGQPEQVFGDARDPPGAVRCGVQGHGLGGHHLRAALHPGPGGDEPGRAADRRADHRQPGRAGAGRRRPLLRSRGAPVPCALAAGYRRAPRLLLQLLPPRADHGGGARDGRAPLRRPSAAQGRGDPRADPLGAPAVQDRRGSGRRLGVRARGAASARRHDGRSERPRPRDCLRAGPNSPIVSKN